MVRTLVNGLLLGLGYANLGWKNIQRLYVAVCGIIVVLTLVLISMWVVNIVGYKEFNLIPYFFGVIILLVFGHKPEHIGLAGLTGAVVQFTRDLDASKGLVNGIDVWSKIVTIVVIGFIVIAGILSTIPFQSHPGVFWIVAAGLTAVTVVYVHYRIPTQGLIVKGIVAYSLLVIGLAFWSMLPSDSHAKRLATVVDSRVESVISWAEHGSSKRFRAPYEPAMHVINAEGICLDYDAHGHLLEDHPSGAGERWF